MEEFSREVDRAIYLQNILINTATSGEADNGEYQYLRKYYLDNPSAKTLIPSWIGTCRDLAQFWQFIKYKFPTYAERRSFIWAEFSPLIDYLEKGGSPPPDQSISEVLRVLNSENVNIVWAKAIERRQTDPEGAITAARTLLESICKHILDDKKIEYNDSSMDLPELYHLVSSELDLSPSHHTEKIFKQILGGCTSVVNGLGALRNQLGDAHGKGKTTYRPAPRHAELAVNLAGALAMFLVETWEFRKVGH